LSKFKTDIQEREGLVDKARQQNAELTRELVDATNESGQVKNEVRILRDKVKKMQQEL